MLDRIKIATFLLGSVVAIPFFASPEFRSFLDRSAFEIGLTDQNTGRLGNLFAPDIREEVPPSAPAVCSAGVKSGTACSRSRGWNT